MLKKSLSFFLHIYLSLKKDALYNLELKSKKKKNIGKFDDAGIDKNLIF